jgi:hypothetical protein
MTRRLAFATIIVLLSASLATPVAAARASVDRIEDLDTVLAVAMPDDFPIASLMRATCTFVIRVERPDGSATETQICQLSDEPVMIPAFQGAPPDRAFRNAGGACIWQSDYWFAADGSTVMASSFRYVVTPSGRVRATSHYPAEPLVCE